LPKAQDKYLTDFFRKTDKVLGELLGPNPLAIIWEAIPFSFAIDWLLSLDNVLDDLWLRELSGAKIEMSRSQKLETVRTWSWRYLSGMGPNPSVSLNVIRPPESQWIYSTIIGEIESSLYVREPMALPPLLTNVRIRGGPKQAFLGILIALGIR
jgi:hypothetical protein